MSRVLIIPFMLKYWIKKKVIVYPAWPGIDLSNLRLNMIRKYPRTGWVDRYAGKIIVIESIMTI